MRQRLRSKLTYANVMSTLAVVLVIGGGTAAAAVTITSNSQVGPDTISGHHVSRTTHANIIGGSVNETDIADGSVKGADIGNGSVKGADIGDGSVKGADIGDGSVKGVDIANDSVTEADFAGPDVTVDLNIPAMSAGFCYVDQLSVPGAKLGDVVILGDAQALNISVEPIRVFATNQVSVRVCNPTKTSSPAFLFNVRVVILR